MEFSVVSRETQWHCDLVGGLSVKRSGFQTRVDHCVVFLGLRLYPHTCCEYSQIKGKKVKSELEPSILSLSHYSMKQVGVLILPPGWDSSLMQVPPPSISSSFFDSSSPLPNPFNPSVLSGERHNRLGKISNTDL